MPEHVAFVFPGRRYGPDMPLLRYPSQGLVQLGADLHVIDYPEVLTGDEEPSEQQWQQAVDVIGQLVKDRLAGAPRVTLLAKSLGTQVIGRLNPDLLPAQVAAVWITPIFLDPHTAEGGSRLRCSHWAPTSRAPNSQRGRPLGFISGPAARLETATRCRSRCRGGWYIPVDPVSPETSLLSGR